MTFPIVFDNAWSFGIVALENLQSRLRWLHFDYHCINDSLVLNDWEQIGTCNGLLHTLWERRALVHW